ncbi:hypothetical protein D918_09191 [Trichuris suis]|nr:hypothetical protein D918_09191 [Trichuris suis]
MEHSSPRLQRATTTISAEIDVNDTARIYGDEPVQFMEVLYAIMAVASASFLMNCLAAVGIVLQKKLRRKNTFFIIMLTCLSYACHALGIIIYGIKTVVEYDNYRRIFLMTQRDCLCLMLLSSIGKTMIVDFSLITAIDRCIAIFFPLWYGQRIRFRLVYIKLAIVATHVVISYSIEYASSSDEILLPCSSFSIVVVSNGMMAMQIEEDVFIVLIVIIYVVLLIWVEKELNKAKHDADNLAHARTQMKVELLHTLVISIVFFSLTVAVSNMLITVGMVEWGDYDALEYVRFAAVGYLGGIANFAVYYWRTKEIRKSFNYLIITLGRMAVCKFDRKISVLPTTTSVVM